MCRGNSHMSYEPEKRKEIFDEVPFWTSYLFFKIFKSCLMRSCFLVFSLSPPSLFSAVFSIVEQVLLILYLILMYHLTFFFPSSACRYREAFSAIYFTSFSGFPFCVWSARLRIWFELLRCTHISAREEWWFNIMTIGHNSTSSFIILECFPLLTSFCFMIPQCFVGCN